ncbi:MAG: hypothetical protein JXR97_12375 [Planctomycetes bacterium]|nr:hypothetical protein [Planctomycetota bacterium]
MKQISLFACVLVFSIATMAAFLSAGESVPVLDPDGNGLYDDEERKVMLDVLQQECPELKANYDADGDGKVTILEQTQGRHPLSLRIPKRMLQSNTKIPWAIDLFPEWVMSGYLQEDIEIGPVMGHMARGTIKYLAEQKNAALQPQKRTAKGGIEFAANSGQHFTIPGQRDARWNYRWCLMTFRIDANSGTDQETLLLELNRGTAGNKSSPKIWYDKATGLNIEYVGEWEGKLDKRLMTATNVIADGQTWNVIVCGTRYGKVYASVNGTPLYTKEKQRGRFSGPWAKDCTTYLGDDNSKGNMAWAYDALAFGETEPSEATVRKLSGWAAHRLGFQASLPGDHPYKAKRPVMDKEDFPYRYIHDDEKWMAWGATLTKETTRVNAGGKPVRPEGFERVFYDDFRAFRAKPSADGEGDIWYGPGFNVAVGIDAKLIPPGQEPNVYPYDAKNKQQTVTMAKRGKGWVCGTLYTINEMGYGHTWAGPKVVRVRYMLPKMSSKGLPKGLFYGIWGYSNEWLFWRTGNRIEVDYTEPDGVNGWWYNGLSSHYHYCHVKNIFAKNVNSYKRFKVYSGEMRGEKSKLPYEGIFLWDGKFHTWEWIIDEDMTYVNATVYNEEGKEELVEICRTKTAPTYLQRLDLHLNCALKKSKGAPKDGQNPDFTFESVEILQKTSDLNTVTEPFTAKPELTGEAKVGGTITCTPNLKGITDVRYYWFADGYPLTWGDSDSWTVKPEQAGAKIRCKVKAVGACSMPEAWSDELAVPALEILKAD